ncbi:MAG: hypothetical protein E4H36_00460 [Spirochaetales bacterium]|nr:MAG: hypothetical protein E4H36_00460 [Spirochaetales bacterium]
MRILVNDREVDVTLEQEKTLGEVVVGMAGWLEDSGYVITSLVKDGVTLGLPEKSSWEGLNIEEVGNLNIYSKLYWEAELDDYLQILDFLNRLHNGVSREKQDYLEDSLAEERQAYLAVNRIASPSSEIVESPDNTVLFTLTAELAGMMQEPGSKGKKDQLLNLIHMYIIIINERIQEIHHPLEEFTALADLIMKTVDRINDVSILLQTGKDREAMESIILFTELSQKIIRLYPLLIQKQLLSPEDAVIEGRPLTDFYTDLNTVLGEMLEAFQSQDSVLLGDLLEYEVSPRLVKLAGFIRKVNPDYSKGADI